MKSRDNIIDRALNLALHLGRSPQPQRRVDWDAVRAAEERQEVETAAQARTRLTREAWLEDHRLTQGPQESVESHALRVKVGLKLSLDILDGEIESLETRTRGRGMEAKRSRLKLEVKREERELVDDMLDELETALLPDAVIGSPWGTYGPPKEFEGCRECKREDVWKNGSHRLANVGVCDDCREKWAEQRRKNQTPPDEFERLIDAL